MICCSWKPAYLLTPIILRSQLYYTAHYKGELKPASEIESLEFFSFSRKAESSPVDHLIFDDLKRKGLIG